MSKKSILITGSNGLIGKQIKKFFSKKNFKSFGLDLKSADSNTISCDITSEKQVKNAFKILNKSTSLDILINNASLNPSKIEKLKKKTFKFSNYDFESWKKAIEVDLIGSFLVTREASKIFEKKNKGLIINISSIYGLIGPDQNLYGKRKKYHGFKPLEYSVAKAGVIGFTKALASFYKGTNIKVICLILGGVFDNQPKNFVKKYSERTIENRMMNIKELINYIEFYTSKENTYSSGNCIFIDGGKLSMF